MVAVVAQHPSSGHLQRWAVPALLLAFFLFYLLPLMTHGLWTPDETRYAQVSQGMLHSGNWVAPHFMGLRYFEKPVAGYWMIAVGQAVFGENLFGVRIASALASGLSVWLVWLMARRLWNDPRKTFASALLYMSFGLVAGQAGYADLDPQFTFWVNLSLVALWFALDSHSRRGRLCAWAMLGIACGLGFMTKGFLALLLPVLIGIPYALWQRRFKDLLIYGPLAILLAVALCLPWALAIQHQEPDFWQFFFWNEHVRRFSAINAQHTQPWWFYLPLLFAACLPWAALLPSALIDAWKHKHRPAFGFLLLWLLLPLGVLSLSKGKLPTYILPCLLPLALLMGHGLISWLNQGRGRLIRINGLLNVLLGVAGLGGLIYLQAYRPVYDSSEMFSLSLGFIVLTGWILANALQALRPLKLWAAAALGIGLLVALLPAAMPNDIINSKMPDQFIAEHLQELAGADTLLSNDLGAASALAWRLGRPEVNLYNTTGELKYGLDYPDSAARQVDIDSIAGWMKTARQRGSVGVVMRIHSALEVHEVELLPLGGKRYERGNLAIYIYPKDKPE